MPDRDKLKGEPVNEDISPQDEMIRQPPQAVDRKEYFRLGRRAVEVLRRAMRLVGADEPKTILDLPSGHGRVMRNLEAAFPEASLTACDLDQGAVDFCAETFGATPVYATAHPRDMSFAHAFDLIWSGSLLTHLEAERFIAFLDLFYSHLNPGGILAFTTNGRRAYELMRHILPEGDPSKTAGSALETHWAQGYFQHFPEPLAGVARSYEREGFGYLGYWFMDDFGASLSSPAWVCKQLERFPELSLAIYLEHGWGLIQDLLVCHRRPRPFQGADG